MTTDEAIQCLNGKDAKPSEYGQAAATLFEQYKSYKKIATHVKRSTSFISQYHAIYQLPKGIQYQCDQKNIRPNQAKQLHKLKSEDEKWHLALTIVEKKLDGKEVDGIMKQVAAGQSLADALRVVAGVGDLFTNGLGVPLIIPPALLVPLTRRAWKCQQ